MVGQYKLALAAGRKSSSGPGAGRLHQEDAGDCSSCAPPCSHSTCTDNCCSQDGGEAPVGAGSGRHGQKQPSDDRTVEAYMHDGERESCGCAEGACTAAAEAAGQHLLHVCDGFWLAVTDASVQLIGSDAAALLEEADEIEDLRVGFLAAPPSCASACAAALSVPAAVARKGTACLSPALTNVFRFQRLRVSV